MLDAGIPMRSKSGDSHVNPLVDLWIPGDFPPTTTRLTRLLTLVATPGSTTCRRPMVKQATRRLLGAIAWREVSRS